MWALASGLAGVLLAGAAEERGSRPVSREEIREAMEHSQGYDLTATANGARLHAEVILRLVRAAIERDPQGPPLRLGYAEWYEALLERTGLTPANAPLYARLAFEHRQDTDVDYRRDRVLRGVLQGPSPGMAANVRTSWPDVRGAPQKYSYDDTLSSPQLRVTMERVVEYRLLDYGDMRVFDEIDGLRGRPTSGVLGVLFDLIGEVPLRESRMAVSSDGLQISRGFGRKGPIGATATVTVYPNGRAEKGLPPNRPDLVAIEQRLRVSLKLSYVPLPPPARQPTAGLP